MSKNVGRDFAKPMKCLIHLASKFYGFCSSPVMVTVCTEKQLALPQKTLYVTTFSESLPVELFCCRCCFLYRWLKCGHSVMFCESGAPFFSSGLQNKLAKLPLFFIPVVQHICNHNDGSSLPSRIRVLQIWFHLLVRRELEKTLFARRWFH